MLVVLGQSGGGGGSGGVLSCNYFTIELYFISFILIEIAIARSTFLTHGI